MECAEISAAQRAGAQPCPGARAAAKALSLTCLASCESWLPVLMILLAARSNCATSTSGATLRHDAGERGEHEDDKEEWRAGERPVNETGHGTHVVENVYSDGSAATPATKSSSLSLMCACPSGAGKVCAKWREQQQLAEGPVQGAVVALGPRCVKMKDGGRHVYYVRSEV